MALIFNTQSGNYQMVTSDVTANDNILIEMQGSSSIITMVLPSSVGKGDLVGITYQGTIGSLTINPSAGGELICGQTALTIPNSGGNPYPVIWLCKDATG